MVVIATFFKNLCLWIGALPRWEVLTYRMINGNPQLPAERSVFWRASDATAEMDRLSDSGASLSLIGFISHYEVVGNRQAISTQWLGTNLAPKVREVKPSWHYPAGLQVVEA